MSIVSVFACPICRLYMANPLPAFIATSLHFGPNPTPHAQIEWTKTSEVKICTCVQETGWTAPRNATFHLFPRLPLELRLMIWQLAIPNQRVIEIRSWGNPSLYAPIKYSVTPHRIPVVLQVNKESRREALRSYRLIEIGVSTWQHYNPSNVYIPWKYHAANPNSDLKYTVWNDPNGGRPLDPTMPYAPQKVYIDFSRDTVYFGPEFSCSHLESFLTATGSCQELPGLQYLALDRKLWLGSQGRWEALRNALYALRQRPLKELYIIPDDQRYALDDRYYYHRHRIALRRPEWGFTFRPFGQDELAKTVVENLGEWFDRLWGVQAPKVMWKSVVRSGKGRSSDEYKNAAWEIQKALGDMRLWKTWLPASSV